MSIQYTHPLEATATNATSKAEVVNLSKVAGLVNEVVMTFKLKKAGVTLQKMATKYASLRDREMDVEALVGNISYFMELKIRNTTFRVDQLQGAIDDIKNAGLSHKYAAVLHYKNKLDAGEYKHLCGDSGIITLMKSQMTFFAIDKKGVLIKVACGL